jgi:hypothetical protein
MHRDERRSSLRLNPEATPARFIVVEDGSPDPIARSRQVVAAFAKAIQLAGKRGRVAQTEDGEIDAAA